MARAVGAGAKGRITLRPRKKKGVGAVYIPVLVLVALVVGAALGAWRAKRRGGKGLDVAQYGAAHAIPLMLLALFVTIYFDRAGQ